MAMKELSHNESLQTLRTTSKAGRRLRNLLNYLTDWRLLVPGFLITGYVAGILSVFVIGGSHPVAVVHQGPYALTGLYQGKVYELIPLEDAIRLRQSEKNHQQSTIRSIGSRNPIVEDLYIPADSY